MSREIFCNDCGTWTSDDDDRDEDLNGHCDTCGARCDNKECVYDRTHIVALDIADAVESDPEDPLMCGRCGNPYSCGNCGYEIDLSGQCLRGRNGGGESCSDPASERTDK